MEMQNAKNSNTIWTMWTVWITWESSVMNNAIENLFTSCYNILLQNKVTNKGYQIYLHRFWFAISLAVNYSENHFISKFWNYCIATIDVFHRRSDAIARIVYTKLKQIISLRRKVNSDWTASAELDCISAQELKKNFAELYT